MDLGQGQEEGPAVPLTQDHGDTKVPDVSYKLGGSRWSRQAAWEDVKPTIISLYWDEDKTLLEVMKIMNVDHAFDASAKQYKRMLSRWNRKKIVSPATMDAISGIRQRRLVEQSKETKFSIRGRPLSTRHIERWNRRNRGQGKLESVATPSDVTYCTDSKEDASNSFNGVDVAESDGSIEEKHQELFDPPSPEQPYHTKTDQTVGVVGSYTVAGNSMDSGYASGVALAGQKDDTCHQDTSLESDLTVIKEWDTRTMYSDEGSISGADVTIYKVELVDDLVAKVRELGAGEESLDRMLEALPSLLKALALKLGQPGSSKSQRDVMYFIHRYRHDLTQMFKETMLEQVENNIVLEKKIERVDNEVISSRIKTWLASLDTQGLDDVAQHTTQTTSLSDNALTLPDDEEIIVLDKRGYRETIFDSEAYKALAIRLASETFLAPLSDSDAMRAIWSKVLATLPIEKYISRREESSLLTMTIVVRWDPIAFLEDQYRDTEKPVDLLGRVITLTGSASNAQALPCSEYVAQTWPTTGPHILATVSRAVQTQAMTTKILPDGSEIEVEDSQGHLHLIAKGTADFIGVAAEVMAWLGAALRSSGDGIMKYCTPQMLNCKRIGGSTDYTCLIDFKMGPDVKTEAGGGCCWHGMFGDPVIVKGFPIRIRSRENTGLEIPLDMAASLIDAKRLHSFGGQLHLKGFSAMLVPTEIAEGLAFWHLSYNPTGGRVSYLDAHEGTGTIKVNALKSCRHVIGWCPEALYLAGDASANFDVGGSDLPIPGKEITLEKITLSGGQFVFGGCQFAIGKKDQPIHFSKESYIKKLQWARQRYVVLWDEEDKRGWLVNGTSALLHMFRASLEQFRHDDFSSEFLFDESAFQPPPADRRFQAKTAIITLLNANNRKLRLYRLKEDITEETVIRPDGGRETWTKVRTSYTTVEDRVSELFESFEKIVDHQAQEEGSTKGLDMKSWLSHNHLQGWDFRDVVTDSDPIYLRVASLPSCGQTWVGFTKSIRAVVLFGRGFGDLIKPARALQLGSWGTMSSGKGLLGACVADLRDIIDRQGDIKAQPLILSTGILWHNPLQHSPFEVDNLTGWAKWGPVQNLCSTNSPPSSMLSKNKSSGPIGIDSYKKGAVIFGRPKSSGMMTDIIKLKAKILHEVSENQEMSEGDDKMHRMKPAISIQISTDADEHSSSAGAPAVSLNINSSQGLSPTPGSSETVPASWLGSGTQATTLESPAQSTPPFEAETSVSGDSVRPWGTKKRPATDSEDGDKPWKKWFPGRLKKLESSKAGHSR